MIPTIALDESDQKTKKTWLKITIFRLIVIPFIQILLVLPAFFIDNLSIKELVPSGLMFLICILFFFGLYRRTYKNILHTSKIDSIGS
jgi:hypothetical protein